MSAYLQLGDRSWNLLDEDRLGAFRGAIVSPVNDDPATVRARIAALAGRNAGSPQEFILDPQLYNPYSERGKLAEWRYFPDDFATAARGDLRWWSNVARSMIEEGRELGVHAVCSPAEVPTVWSDDYFRLVVAVADQTKQLADAAGLSTLMTVIVRLRDLANPRRAYDIASILTASRCERLYLTFQVDDAEPRDPIMEADGLPTAVHLIRLLSRDMRVLVAFAGHDLVMWKYAGAADASSGKFFNLRRFCPSRWTEEEGGGRQNPYWNEERLLTLLREADVGRLRRVGWFDGRTFPDNPAGGEIFQILESGERRPWVQLSWLQYLRWFSNTEQSLGTPSAAEHVLVSADAAWGELQRMRPPILFTDRDNTGEHTRLWLNSVREGGAR